jgi:hypothetical protein
MNHELHESSERVSMASLEGYSADANITSDELTSLPSHDDEQTIARDIYC